VVHADGPATPYAGTRSAGQGVLSASTTHEVTGRVLRSGLRPPVPLRLAACHGSPGSWRARCHCRRPGVQPGACCAGRAGLAQREPWPLVMRDLPELPSCTKSTEPEDRARRSEVSVHHDSRKYSAISPRADPKADHLQ
jgi:hypothetical protein